MAVDANNLITRVTPGAVERPRQAGGSADKKAGSQSGSRRTGANDLTPDEEHQVAELKTRDRQVRQHEAAHLAAGAGIAGRAHFTYQTGPDGNRYAVGGEVTIDVSPERDPQSTATKMNQVQRAALAPADPSAQDRAVARQAAAEMRDAQRQIQEAARGGASTPPPGTFINIKV
jgi:hypothetical protein